MILFGFSVNNTSTDDDEDLNDEDYQDFLAEILSENLNN